MTQLLNEVKPTVTILKNDPPAICLQNLTKTYGRNRGVTNLSLEVAPGEIFGFLGPNGAGKTTTIRMLLNLITPTGGRAFINGLDCQRESLEVRKQIGYLPGEFALYPNLTGAQTLQYFANLRGGVEWSRIASLARRLELDPGKKFRQYSRGNKQKVGIIQAIMHRPKLLILDEPTGGLDPLNQQEFYRLVKEAREEGSTVFFSSHIMSEVEKTCDRVAIIREGRLVKVGQLSELNSLKIHQLEMVFATPVESGQFLNIPGVGNLEFEQTSEGNLVRCTVRPEAFNPVMKLATNFGLLHLDSHEPGLEESFLEYYRSTSPEKESVK